MFFFSGRRRHTRYWRDWSSDVCSSDLGGGGKLAASPAAILRDLEGDLARAFPAVGPERGRGREGAAERHRRHRAEIGRAQCRERGVDLGGGRIIKKKKTSRHSRQVHPT